MKHTPDTTKADTHPIHTPLPESLKSVVNERGFALYKWISVEELGLSIRADYLSIIQRSSIPLAVVTLIAGFI